MGRTGRIFRRVRANFTDSPTFFGWVEERKLSASGLPSSERQLSWLAKQGVKSVLTLTEDPLPNEWLERSRMNGVHIAMGDHSVPTVEQLREAVALIRKELDDGRTVHVHCLAGKGRTGMVLAAYLATEKGMKMRDAIEYIRRIRPGSIEFSQATLLDEYGKSLEETDKRRR